MSVSSVSFILFLCCMFFVVLFFLEGYSDDGIEGIKQRRVSISGTLSIALFFLILFIFFFPTR